MNKILTSLCTFILTFLAILGGDAFLNNYFPMLDSDLAIALSAAVACASGSYLLLSTPSLKGNQSEKE